MLLTSDTDGTTRIKRVLDKHGAGLLDTVDYAAVGRVMHIDKILTNF